GERRDDPVVTRNPVLGLGELFIVAKALRISAISSRSELTEPARVVKMDES
ncbi:hypothetical protein C0993_012167, partial [Termitomyces sp. T159_Od127]